MVFPKDSLLSPSTEVDDSCQRWQRPCKHFGGQFHLPADEILWSRGLHTARHGATCMAGQRSKATANSSAISADWHNGRLHSESGTFGVPFRSHGRPALRKKPPIVRAERSLEELTLLATLFEPAAASQALSDVSADSKKWPDILNLTRTISPLELVALAAFRSSISATPESHDVMAFTEKLAADKRWRAEGGSLPVQERP